jgi:FAD:protein FMN transferase
VTHRFRAMGCEVVADIDGDPVVVERLFASDDRRFTRFAKDSELARVNCSQRPVLVSQRFARAVAAALRAWRQTDYDRDFSELRPDPRPAEVGKRGQAAAIRLTGRLLARPPSLRLDLNGVVKAMAVDDALTATGGRGWISAGGDIATGRALEVAVPGGGSVRLEHGALATSGSTGRRWLRGGEQQHHLIDPRSGRPADSPWAQVTVCGSTCLAADTAAKAAFLLGSRGPRWLDARGMPGRFIGTDGSVVANEAWRVATCT